MIADRPDRAGPKPSWPPAIGFPTEIKTLNPGAAVAEPTPNAEYSDFLSARKSLCSLRRDRT